MYRVPVRGVEDGRERIAQHVRRGQQVRDEDEHAPDHRHQHEEGGQQPAGPPRPKTPQPDGARVGPLADQQRRDEVAGEHEEGIDAVEAARDEADPGVEGDQAEHSHGPDAVQTPDVREVGPPSAGRRQCVSVRAHAEPQDTAR